MLLLLHPRGLALSLFLTLYLIPVTVLKNTSPARLILGQVLHVVSLHVLQTNLLGRSTSWRNCGWEMILLFLRFVFVIERCSSSIFFRFLFLLRLLVASFFSSSFSLCGMQYDREGEVGFFGGVKGGGVLGGERGGNRDVKEGEWSS